MKVFCFASLLAVATAFTSPNVFRKAISVNTADVSDSHRTRQATVVHDGKANGTCLHMVLLVLCVCNTRTHPIFFSRYHGEALEAERKSRRLTSIKLLKSLTDGRLTSHLFLLLMQPFVTELPV